jgi:hypothetical protein
MERTAEEFVHELPNGRWFVGDFVKATGDGDKIFLVEARKGRGGVELAAKAIAAPITSVRTYARKSSAKRAAQRMIERVLDEYGRHAIPSNARQRQQR